MESSFKSVMSRHTSNQEEVEGVINGKSNARIGNPLTSKEVRTRNVSLNKEGKEDSLLPVSLNSKTGIARKESIISNIISNTEEDSTVSQN